MNQATAPNETKKAPDWQTRVVDEREALKEKTDKLFAFLETEEFIALPGIAQEDLALQYASMCGYLRVLDRRISRFSAQRTT